VNKVKRVFSGKIDIQDILEGIIATIYDIDGGESNFQADSNVIINNSVTLLKSTSILKEGVIH
jgi:hypothetical protein